MCCSKLVRIAPSLQPSSHSISPHIPIHMGTHVIRPPLILLILSELHNQHLFTANTLKGDNLPMIATLKHFKDGNQGGISFPWSKLIATESDHIQWRKQSAYCMFACMYAEISTRCTCQNFLLLYTLVNGSGDLHLYDWIF